MAHLSLSLLGPFQVALAGESVTSFESNKVRALLVYLAVESARPHPREVWPGCCGPSDRVPLPSATCARPSATSGRLSATGWPPPPSC